LLLEQCIWCDRVLHAKASWNVSYDPNDCGSTCLG